MTDQGTTDGDFRSVVSEASQAVKDRNAAQVEAAERQKPKARGPILAITTVLLVIVGVYDYVALNAPPEVPPPAEVAQDMRVFVATLAREVEAFRAQEGRLPTANELTAEGLIEDDIDYVVDGDNYSITFVDVDVSVSYDGSVPVDTWVIGETP